MKFQWSIIHIANGIDRHICLLQGLEVGYVIVDTSSGMRAKAHTSSSTFIGSDFAALKENIECKVREWWSLLPRDEGIACSGP